MCDFRCTETYSTDGQGRAIVGCALHNKFELVGHQVITLEYRTKPCHKCGYDFEYPIDESIPVPRCCADCYTADQKGRHGRAMSPRSGRLIRGKAA